MFHCNCNGCFSIKGHTSCYHFKHYDTQRINIAFCITVAASRLLRGSIVHRTHCIGCDSFGSCSLSNAKVHDLHLSVFGNHDILWFYVSVYDIIVMSHFQTHGNLYSDTCGFLDGHPAFSLNIIFQSNAFYKLHHNIMISGFLPYIIYIYNIRMCKACCRLRFFFKFADKIFIFTIFGF